MPDRILYEKVGRRYKQVATDYDRFVLGAGKHLLVYSPTPVRQSYQYEVTPDTAAWVAAAQIAKDAMESAIVHASRPRPQSGHTIPYTARQLELIENFRRDMKDAGGLMPEWWQHISAHEIAQAGVDAVKRA